MSKIKVLYVDADKKYGKIIRSTILKEDDLELIDIVTDGEEALRKIDETRPDVIVIDTVLPKLDGMGVLEEMKMKYKGDMPSIIVVSKMANERLIEKATDVLGAKYYMNKPYRMSVLIRRIKEVGTDYKNLEIDSTVKDKEYYRKFKARTMQEIETLLEGYDKLSEKEEKKTSKTSKTKKKKNIIENCREKNRAEVVQSFINSPDESLTKKVIDILDGLNTPAHLVGYAYLTEAIIMVAKRRNYLQGVTKNLYPDIAKKYNTTSTRVERAIRHAIEVIFFRGDKENLDKIFNLPANKHKPTNSEFIAFMANIVRES